MTENKTIIVERIASGKHALPRFQPIASIVRVHEGRQDETALKTKKKRVNKKRTGFGQVFS